MTIYCCGFYHPAEKKLHLQDNEIYENRFIEIITCPKCLKQKAVLSQRRIKDGKLIEKRSKRGRVDAFIKKWTKEAWEDMLKPPKNGSFSDMYWLYLCGADNQIRDFNETVRESVENDCKVSFNKDFIQSEQIENDIIF